MRINSHGHRPGINSSAIQKAAQLKRLPLNSQLPTHALVINLPQSKERLANFNSVNVFYGNTHVIEGVDGSLIEGPVNMLSGWKGDVGCIRSHKKALQYAKDCGFSMVIIFEDDVRFITDFNTRLKSAMQELPETWDMLWLGGKDRYKSLNYSSNLKVNTGMWGAYGIVVRNTVYDFFIEKFSEEVHSTDDYYSEYHSKFNSFKTTTDLVIHTGVASDRITRNVLK